MNIYKNGESIITIIISITIITFIAFVGNSILHRSNENFNSIYNFTSKEILKHNSNNILKHISENENIFYLNQEYVFTTDEKYKKILYNGFLFERICYNIKIVDNIYKKICQIY